MLIRKFASSHETDSPTVVRRDDAEFSPRLLRSRHDFARGFSPDRASASETSLKRAFFFPFPAMRIRDGPLSSRRCQPHLQLEKRRERFSLFRDEYRSDLLARRRGRLSRPTNSTRLPEETTTTMRARDRYSIVGEICACPAIANRRNSRALLGVSPPPPHLPPIDFCVASKNGLCFTLGLELFFGDALGKGILQEEYLL